MVPKIVTIDKSCILATQIPKLGLIKKIIKKVNVKIKKIKNQPKFLIWDDKQDFSFSS
jgi:hypothetical protein